MKKFIAVLSVFTLLGSAVPTPADAQTEVLTDSGIDYSESVSTINNPGAGYTSTVWYVCKPGDTPVKNPTGNLVVLFVDIGAFSSALNGGNDYDLDEAFFTGIRGTLENCRRNGSTVGLRFRYDANGVTDPEPETFDKVLEHIQQIADNGFLYDYEDILMYVESGFVGAWGEQHSGKYTSLEYKAKLLDALLKIVPKSVSVTVRTPNTICEWAGIKAADIAGYVTEKGSDAARIGLYNDGYMGSDSDLGTYISPSREASVEFMDKQMTHAYYGGEFSGNIDFAKQYDTYLPENAIPEMFKTHLSYINSNIWSLYRDFTYTAELDTQPCDNSAYYGENVYRFIRDHIGYRFVIRSSRLTAETKQGGNVNVEFKVENTGFANPLKKQNAQVLLEKDGRYMLCDTDIDSTEWYSAMTSSEEMNITLPSDIEPGKWNVYIKLTAGNTDPLSPKRTVRFVNPEIYNDDLGANYLGSVNVTSDQKAHKSRLCEDGNDPSDGVIYDYNGRISIDGKIGDREWKDSDIIAETDNSRFYLKSDTEAFYVCAAFPDTAEAPVYNLQWKTETAEKQSWIYYASNGFVYFNGDDRTGVECKFSKGVVEWKIPLNEAMQLHSGDKLSSIRVFLQDSANEWSLIDDLRAGDIQLAVSSKGDVNADGSFNIADLVCFNRWIVQADGAELADWRAGDIIEDGTLNVFDLIAMRRLLWNNLRT